MKKDYNRDVMSDMPVDASFTPSVQAKTEKKTTTAKPKINAIGTQKRTTGTKTSTSKTGTAKSTQAKSSSKTTKTSSKFTTQAKELEVETEGKKKKLRTQLTNSESELTDLEKLNEENIKSYRFKSKRNRVVIVILSVLLVITIATVATFLIVSRLKTNCNFYIHGDVSASFIIDGIEMDEFRTPSNLQGNRTYKLDIKVRIDSNASYKIRFVPECYQKGVLMENTLVYEYNTDLFYEGVDGYYSINPIQGGQTITLCGGIILDYYYENSLTADNFKLDFHVYFEKV